MTRATETCIVVTALTSKEIDCSLSLSASLVYSFSYVANHSKKTNLLGLRKLHGNMSSLFNLYVYGTQSIVNCFSKQLNKIKRRSLE